MQANASKCGETQTNAYSPLYRALRNGYISNSKTLKSVSVSASVTVNNSQTIKVCICNPENRQTTDMVTDIPKLITDPVTDILNGFLGLGRGSGNNMNYMSVTDT